MKGSVNLTVMRLVMHNLTDTLTLFSSLVRIAMINSALRKHPQFIFKEIERGQSKTTRKISPHPPFIFSSLLKLFLLSIPPVALRNICSNSCQMQEH